MVALLSNFQRRSHLRLAQQRRREQPRSSSEAFKTRLDIAIDGVPAVKEPVVGHLCGRCLSGRHGLDQWGSCRGLYVFAPRW